MATPPQPPAAGPSPQVLIVRELLREFWLERYAFLGLSVLAGLVTVYAGFEALHDKSNLRNSLGLFFGSGGVTTFTVGRLLTFFDKITKIAFG
jgi:hypothetical protein